MRRRRRAITICGGLMSVLALWGAAPVASATKADVLLGVRASTLVLSAEPASVRLGGRSVVTVSRVTSPRVEVRLVGATSAQGRLLGWRRLTRSGDRWSGLLPRPALRGVYPIQLRTGPGAPILGSARWVLHVVAPGTIDRPAFATSEAVAAWWAATVPVRRSHLVAARRWPLPATDRRDPRLHRLFVIAYERVGDARVNDRLGMWITAFRSAPHKPWRLLEATVQPPR